MRALLDVNVLIALLDAAHVHHGRARAWLAANVRHGWASCPITENGCVRILSQPAYPGHVTPAQAATLLREATLTRHHAFLPDDASLLDEAAFEWRSLLTPRQLTDAYLLALASRHGACFATFDERVALAAVPGAGSRHLVVI
ncbi:MAG: PIN domain-containing protein [Rhodanobacteraceae bacterium]|nr:MAG: PIN domain-containing protein [Rhodanobacteraceae bacterium]